MQDATKIQEQMGEMVQHQESKSEVATEQLKFVAGNKLKAQEEIAKFQVLREGLKAASAFLSQQQIAHRAQPEPNPITLVGFDGALLHLNSLVEQTGGAISKNEGSFVAFSTMETQLLQTIQAATARGRGLEVQGERAVELASRSGEIAEVIEEAADEEPAPAPIASAKKKTSSNSKKGKGRKTKR